MKLIGTYNGKPIELELTEEQVELLRPKRKKTGWERIKEGESYWTYDASSMILEFHEASDCQDDGLFSHANYFSDETLAQNISRTQELQRKLWRRSAELCEKVDWSWRNPEIPKYCISYNVDENELFINFVWVIKDFGEVYFDTKEHAEQAMSDFYDELIWYFTKFQSRMD